jgi:hypothetical protein
MSSNQPLRTLLAASERESAAVPTRKRMVLKKGASLALAREWVIGEVIGVGGFGRVYAVTSDDEEAVAKLVPKDPGGRSRTPLHRSWGRPQCGPDHRQRRDSE